MKKKKQKKPQSIIEINCSECGRVTKHYLSKNGEYKCLICGKVNKTIPKKEVVFKQDENLFEEPKQEEVFVEQSENLLEQSEQEENLLESIID